MHKGPAGEFAALSLGDKRLEVRARTTLEALATRPSAGAPQVLSDAELEGYYRFVNNDRVTFEALLGAHVAATVQRSKGLERVVVAHDTTDFRFSDEVAREGLGPMDNGGQGFYAHLSLALGPARQALGVVAVEPWTRSSRVSNGQTQGERYADPAKESLRWMRAVRRVEQTFASGPRLVHVMDREGDDYDILCQLVSHDLAFVIRAGHDRRLPGEDGRLKAFARQLEVRCMRGAALGSRRKNRPARQQKPYPPRDAREAVLSFAAETVTLHRPERSRAERGEITVNLVHVHEPAPPPDCEAVEWFLLTSEPIATEEQILQIVDDYRSRWVIEEYFKALKTGCAYEKRQHETKDALLNALGIFIPIAWSLLNLRTLSRSVAASGRPATEVLTPTQLQILRLESKGKLSATPTLREAVLLMARLFGGLQRSNGDPGWLSLGVAFERLLTIETGWRLAARFFTAEARERSDR